ncbi:MULTISPECIES: beta-N-acetylhexosaminidase [unclassified Spirosoma]|mgnify:CR=1 FL=1|uniref:beta-N-acetylhexosaminidase n=1 Tax=unclassified Spirosoma TaxID=2621999 RepID=UPI0009645FA3|nr:MULTISPECIES: beta-N-acetylhexosaminidase [unclassified Spirosoma]MBN8826647.1 beta-N-acetylhexosaminidase [Spirosoma sp.]OJW74484.1 MAG: glycoside hydrolase [Spirosoma sp. 48-14]
MKRFWITCILVYCWSLTALAQQRPILLPQPQSIQYGQGALPLQNLTIHVAPKVPADVLFALNELKKILSERTGKTITPSSSANTATIRYSVKTSGQELPETQEATNGNHREQYAITISAKGLDITAQTSTGLYYAIQTIRQLIQGQGAKATLPFVTINDQPKLAYRGVMMDFAHGGLLTVDEIKKQIDFLARWKTNQYYFYNEVSIQLNGFPTLNYKASYSQAQIRSVIAYARERHMDVIPFVNFYGHLHELIRNEKYASLAIGQYGHELDPRNPAVQTLLKDWIKQYTALFSSPFIHVGFDETWETKRLANASPTKLDPEALYIQQLSFVSNEFKQYGKTLLAWTDMNAFYPNILAKFPTDVIPVIWEYSPDTTAINNYLNPVLKAKKPFFIQPAVSGWGHIYPSADYTYENINLCLKAGLQHNTLGFITSVWTDSVEPFVRASWLFMAYGCIAAWQGTVPDKTTFTGQYSSVVYPAHTQDMQAAFDHIATAGQYLEKCLGKNTQSLPRGTLVESWSNPFSAYYLANTTEHKADFEQVRLHTEEAQARLIRALQQANPADTSFIQSLLVSARLINYSASRFLWAKAITDRWNNGMMAQPKDDYVFYDLTYPCHSLLVDAMDETGELKQAYAQAWNAENMPYRLNTMLGRFDVDFGLWRKLHLKLLDYKIQKKTEPLKSFELMFTPDF